MEETYEAYINPIEHRPKLTKIEDANIPIIDLSCISSIDHLPVTNTAISDPKVHALIAEVGEACEKWGFLKVINHGIPVDKIAKLESEARMFFELPKDEKRKVGRCEVNPMGYFESEHNANVRDWKEGFEFAMNESKAFQLSNRFSESLPNLREIIEEYAREVKKLGVKLLELIALSLQLPANRLTEMFKESTSFIRLNHYAPCPRPDLVLGTGAHKDAGAMVIVYEDDVGGLQLKRKSDGEWVNAMPISGALGVNIGETLQAWSNGKYESVEHRVTVNQEKERHSIQFSFGPGGEINVKPLKELVDEHNPAKYKEFNYGEFRALLQSCYDMKRSYLEAGDLSVEDN